MKATSAPQGKKPRPSIWLLVVLPIVAALLLFAAFSFFTLYSAMLTMLNNSEQEHVSQQNDIASSVMALYMVNAQAAARDWAFRDETYAFAAGDPSDSVRNEWESNVPLRRHHFDFAVIKDAQGNDLYVSYYDFVRKVAAPTPDGLTEFLNPIAMEALRGYHTTEVLDGFVFYGGVVYYVISLPVMPSDESAPPSASIVFGRAFNGTELAAFMYMEQMTFTLREKAQLSQDELENSYTKDTVRIYKELPRLPGYGVAVLEISQPREIYWQGMDSIRKTIAVLAVIVLLLAAVILYLPMRYLLRPLARLNADVRAIGGDQELLDCSRYSETHEFHSLSAAINDTLGRLAESEYAAMQSAISLNVLKNILNGMDVLVYVSHPDTDEILFMNDKMIEHFGLDEGVVGQTCWRVLQAGYTQRCDFCPNHRLSKDPGQVIVWDEVNTVTGRFYKNTDRLIEWSGGEKVHMQHSLDITELKQAENALKRRLEQQELMSAISQSFIDDDDMDSFINKALEMTGGFMNVSRITLAEHDEKDESIELKYVWRADGNQPPARVGSRLPFRAGTPLYDALHETSFVAPLAVNCGEAGTPFEHARGVGIKSFLAIPVFVAGDFWGILEFDQCDDSHGWSKSDMHLGTLVVSTLSGVMTRKRMEGQLVRLSAIVESSPLYISNIQGNGTLEYVNPAAVSITGYSREELLAGGIDLLFDADNGSLVRDALSRTIQAQGLPREDESPGAEKPGMKKPRMENLELPMIRKDGETRVMSVSVFAIGVGANQGGIIAMDITEMRQLENDLIHAKDLAEQSSRSKGEFLSRMSHEMRTPMNAIIGMTGIAKNSASPDKKEYCLDKIDDASKHLLNVINDILDMSKIEANKFELSSGEFDFEKMIMNVTSMVSFRADEKKQELDVNLDERLPRFVIGDEARISQVLTNLLTNAVKFTPDGGKIALSAKYAGEDEDGGCLIQMDVTDNGIGITPEQLSRLFNPFEQADGGIARKYGGTGLGLAISKRVVEMMGGRIWAESKLDEGSTFAFTVIVKKCRDYTLNAKLPSGVNRDDIRILAVDDSPETRKYFRHLMTALNLRCDTARDGAEALAMIENRGGKPYNIFFVDWQMPEMNGIELAKKIRSLTQSDAVIIMISASEWSEIEPEATAAGICRFVPKPLFPSSLIDSINACMGVPGEIKPVQEQAGETGGLEFEGHVLLLAEDMDVNREIIQALLDGTGLIIESAENGLEALNMFKENPGRYSLILMDIHMPEMDGYEATKGIRGLGYAEAANIPIVAMTANVFREDIERCLEAGMNDHLGKPVDTEQLFVKLRAYLKREEQTSGAGEPGGSGGKAQAPGYEKYMPSIDVEDGLKRLMNNKKLLFTLLKKFAGRAMADELIGHIKANDYAQTARAAHALKGVSANLGLKELYGISAKIERQAKMEAGSEHLAGPLDGAVNAAIRSIGMLLEEEGH